MSKGIGDMYGFCARVAFAHQTILSGARPTSKFEDCFKMWDGDFVATALWRKATRESDKGSTRMMDNLGNYLSVDLVEAIANKLDNLPDWKLRENAFDLAEEKNIESFRRWVSEQDEWISSRCFQEMRAKLMKRPKKIETWTI